MKRILARLAPPLSARHHTGTVRRVAPSERSGVAFDCPEADLATLAPGLSSTSCGMPRASAAPTEPEEPVIRSHGSVIKP
eukprot:COSAG01_NODE_38754_length_485_cov_3.523316_1_plen_79_part_01